MARRTINDNMMLQLIDSGLSQAEAARKMGFSRAAVSKRLQELKIQGTRDIVSRNTQKAVDNNLDAIRQLKKINDKANALLDAAEDDPVMAVKLMAEIRGQLKLQLEMFEILYSTQAAREFQQEVLEAIGEADHETKKKIIDRLNQKRALRNAVQFS